MELLTCMNCKAPVEPGDAKIFATVFCCPRCHLMAERLLVRGQQELKQVLILFQDQIRIAMVQGQLAFAEPQQVEELSKKEVLEAILRLQEMKDVRLATLGSRDPGVQHGAPPGSSKYLRKKSD